MKAEKFIEMSKNAYNRYKPNIVKEQKTPKNMFELGYQAALIEHSKMIEDLEHFKQNHVGLNATDKEPDKIFEEIFVHLIEKIGMDGEKTFSAVDYEYYKEFFNKGIKLLMWKIS